MAFLWPNRSLPILNAYANTGQRLSVYSNPIVDSLDIDGDENSLFVVSSDRKTIQKMGLISQKVSGLIEVEEGCYATVLMGGR